MAFFVGFLYKKSLAIIRKLQRNTLSTITKYAYNIILFIENLLGRLKKNVYHAITDIKKMARWDNGSEERSACKIIIKAIMPMFILFFAAALVFQPARTAPVAEEDGAAPVVTRDLRANRENNEQGRQAEGDPAVSRGWINRSDRYLMARVIEGEAADESLKGKVAVGAVILNRTRSEDFPKDIRGVIYQPYAFEAVANGQYNRPLSQESLKAADMAIDGWDPTGGALYYWNPETARSKWVWQRPVTMSIGRHVFAH